LDLTHLRARRRRGARAGRAARLSRALAPALSLSLSLALAFALGSAAAAEPHRTLGLSVVNINDDFLIAEIHDRWRSGGLDVTLVRGTGWAGAPEVRFGEVIAWRFRGEIITPESVSNPRPGDRPYAGALSIGAHSHMRRGADEMRLGADLLFVGPQTGLDSLQRRLHEAQGLSDPRPAAASQIDDATYPVLSGEWARTLPLGTGARLRPFAEARAGDETFARVGLDVVGGALASGGLLVREVVTGQLSEGTRGAATGLGWSAGLDVARVAASVYLPDEAGRPEAEPLRARARLGAMWAGQGWSVFAGSSYLSEEFEGQSEGQIVGAVALTFAF